MVEKNKEKKVVTETYAKFLYLKQKYGLCPLRDYQDFLNQLKKLQQEVSSADEKNFGLTYEDENSMKIKVKGSVGGDSVLWHYIFTEAWSGKPLREEATLHYVVFFVPKVKEPREKVEVVKIPEIREETKDILISEIYIPPDYSRRIIDYQYIFDLSQSIKEAGQVIPIIVVPINYVKNLDKRYPDGKKYKYILIDGLHRIEAIKRLNRLYIRATIKYNDYDLEDLKSFTQERANKLSIIENVIKIHTFIERGFTQEKISKISGFSQSYVSKLEKIYPLVNLFERIDILALQTYETLEYLCKVLSSSKTIEKKKYEFLKSKIIEEFNKGKKEFSVEDIKKYESDFYWKEKEEKYGEVVEVLRKTEEEMAIEKSQKQIEKPIARIPTREEIQEKEVKRRREEKKKTPEEGLERKVDSYSSSFPKDVAQIWKKYAKSKPIVMKKYLTEYRRNCVARIIKEGGLTNEDLERIFKEEVEKFE
ncbi:MAG: ParB N-terminal domain-containing protein [Candidatus Omnitrophica bacterium]|nr:ParB N-terminal domain-containing protein [Candidatus Omnitrophota bacterium]